MQDHPADPILTSGRDRALAGLYATAQDLAALRELDEVLALIVSRAHAISAADLTYLQVYDPATGLLRTRAAEGVVTSAFKSLVVPQGHGIAQVAVERRSPIWVRDYSGAPDFRHDPDGDAIVAAEGVRGLVALPMIAGGQVSGVLYAGFRYTRDFAAAEVALLAAFADHAAIAIANARLFDESRRALAELQQAYATIKSQVEVAERTEKVHEAMTDVVLHGGSLTDIAGILVANLGGAASFLDRLDRQIGTVGPAPLPADPAAQRALDAAISRSRQSGRISTLSQEDGTVINALAVMADRSHLGSLVHQRATPLDPQETSILERAGQTSALIMMMQNSRIEAEERVRGEFLSELLNGQLTDFTSDQLRRGQSRGLDLRKICGLALVTTDSSRTRDAVRALHELHNGRLVGEYAGRAVMLIWSADGDELAEIGQRIWEHLCASLGDGVGICLAPAAPTPASLAAAFLNAERCAAIAAQLGRDQRPVTTDELGIYSVILDPSRGDEMQQFLRRNLGPLLKRQEATLLMTLNAYFDSSMNLKRTAESLGVHVNTVNQRMERISQILGRNPKDGRDQLELQLAARLYALSPGA